MSNADQGTMARIKENLYRVRPLHTLKGFSIGRLCGAANRLHRYVWRQGNCTDNKSVRMLSRDLQRGREK